jgi:hypothetical protein
MLNAKEVQKSSGGGNNFRFAVGCSFFEMMKVEKEI